MKDYDEIVSHIYSLKILGSKFSLEAIKKLTDLLGNPEKYLKIIHVTGTNGKGSVCAMVYSILKSQGYRVGLFTSPHLHTFRDRIIVNDRPIPKKDVVRLWNEIVPLRERMVEFGIRESSAFETLAAMAFKYFKEQKVDFVVLEVGLGGRLDATNIVNPMVSVITKVALDHTHILGRTLSQIAKDKAEIIKDNSYVVTAADKESVLKIIKDKCKRMHSKLFHVGTDITYKKNCSGIDGQTFDVKGTNGYYPSLRIPLIGEHQLTNAATAIAAIEALRKQGVKISDRALKEGLKNAKWPGRFEVVQKNPLVVLDGGHNPDAMRALKKILKALSYKRLILVMGISSSKDIKTMMKIIAPIADKFIITRAEYRGTETSKLKKEVKKYVKDIIVKEKVADAARYARSIAKKDDLVCIGGSLFVVDEARRLWKKVEVDKQNMNFI